MFEKLKELFVDEEREIDEREFDEIVEQVEFEESDYFKCMKVRGKVRIE